MANDDEQGLPTDLASLFQSTGTSAPDPKAVLERADKDAARTRHDRQIVIGSLIFGLVGISVVMWLVQASPLSGLLWAIWGIHAIALAVVVAMGKLGGNEIGFGSDLDVLFIFDPASAPDGVDPHEHFVRRAQRVIRLVSAAHADGRGYELDTRLRPSGSQGLLVTSLASFARYHGVPLAGD